VLTDLGAVEPDADMRAIARAFRQLLDKYHGLPLKRLDLVSIFHELTAVMRTHNVTLPREMVLVLKTITTIAGVALKLDPGLDLVAILTPRLKGLIAGRLSPARLLRAGGVGVWHVLSILRSAPSQLRTALRQVSRGKYQVHIRHENLEHLTKEMDRSSKQRRHQRGDARARVGYPHPVDRHRRLPLRRHHGHPPALGHLPQRPLVMRQPP
jgi:ubiquinone biosynthesis protein